MRKEYKDMANKILAMDADTLAKMMEIEGIASRLSIIEQKENKALYLAKHLSDALVIKGDAMDETILEEAHIKNADAVVSLTGEDEDNILLSLLAIT